jgi:thioredoxin 1
METFQQLISSPIPVIVDFYADWCGPCQAMGPMIKELAGEYKGKARIVKINIDKNQSAAHAYQVEAVPTFIIFKNGKLLWRHAGALDKSTLVRQLQAFA